MKLNVFLAEDDPFILMGFRMMLEKMDHHVVGEASDGETAVRLVQEKKPDLIVMDINMPKLDGISAMEQLNSAGVRYPCIIVTGYRNEQLVSRAQKAGVMGYMQKPIDEFELRTAIGLAMKHFEELHTLEQDLNKAKAALEDRKIIEKAKGLMMESFGLSEAEAMRALQKKSRNQNKKLAEVAREIMQMQERHR